jgi:hypothetical protein
LKIAAGSVEDEGQKKRKHMAARTKKGRRTTGHDAVATIRLSSELRESVDARPQRITWISDHRRKLLTDREPPFGLRENHHPTVRGDPSAIERSCDPHRAVE